MKSHKPPYSTDPIEDIEKKIIALSKGLALMWFGVGLTGGIGLLNLEFLSRIEPLQVKDLHDKSFLIWFIVALLVTGFLDINSGHITFERVESEKKEYLSRQLV